MTISEKVAYLKGLCEGMGINTSGGEGKLLAAIIDTLADIAAEIDNLGENALDLGEEIDAISDDLADVEELLFGDDDDDDDDECCCSDDDDDFAVLMIFMKSSVLHVTVSSLSIQMFTILVILPVPIAAKTLSLTPMKIFMRILTATNS